MDILVDQVPDLNYKIYINAAGRMIYTDKHHLVEITGVCEWENNCKRSWMVSTRDTVLDFLYYKIKNDNRGHSETV